ncbi:hypothetical protein L810_1308 [Burkholderia sp. AU4i]|nr:hypothetical protein L810_1308 [Burkholderia sp. AU4i]
MCCRWVIFNVLLTALHRLLHFGAAQAPAIPVDANHVAPSPAALVT